MGPPRIKSLQGRMYFPPLAFEWGKFPLDQISLGSELVPHLSMTTLVNVETAIHKTRDKSVGKHIGKKHEVRNYSLPVF